METTIYDTLQNGYNKDLWYDWFCKDTQLETRGQALFNKLKQIAFSNKFDITKTYVLFKNNAPLSGGTYDDFRICDMETGDVLFTIIPKYTNGKAEVWDVKQNIKNNNTEFISADNWKGVLKYFNEQDVKL